MKTYHSQTLLLVIISLLTGCETAQVAMDHHDLRRVILNYEEDQIMNNLIRGKNNLPIIHFDFQHISALVTNRLTPTLGGGSTRTSMNTTTPTNSVVTTNQTTTTGLGQTLVSGIVGTASVVGAAAQTVAKPFSWSVGNERDNAIGLDLLPVIDKNEVYDEYERFLKYGDSVRDSLNYTIPKKHAQALNDPDAVHVGQDWNGIYYWVPEKYAKQFFHLCLVAAVKRNPPASTTLTSTSPSSKVLQNTIAGFGGGTTKLDNVAGTVLSVTFKEGMPEDAGTVTATVAGIYRQFLLLPLNRKPFNSKTSPTDQTHFYLVYDETAFSTDIPSLEKELVGKVVDVRLDNAKSAKPSASTTNITIPSGNATKSPEVKALDDVSFQLRQLQLSQ